MQHEEHVDALIEETKLRTVIVHICPNPHDMFANQTAYTEAMTLILNRQKPYSTRFAFLMVHYYQRHGWENQGDQTLKAVLDQRFRYFINGAVPRSETPITDEVLKVLGLLGHDDKSLLLLMTGRRFFLQ